MKTLGLYSIGEAAVRLMIQATTGCLNCCSSLKVSVLSVSPILFALRICHQDKSNRVGHSK